MSALRGLLERRVLQGKCVISPRGTESFSDESNHGGAGFLREARRAGSEKEGQADCGVFEGGKKQGCAPAGKGGGELSIDSVEGLIEENMMMARGLLDDAVQRGRRAFEDVSAAANAAVTFGARPAGEKCTEGRQGAEATDCEGGARTGQMGTSCDFGAEGRGKKDGLKAEESEKERIRGEDSGAGRRGRNDSFKAEEWEKERMLEKTLYQEVKEGKQHAVRLLEAAMLKLEEKKIETERLRAENILMQNEAEALRGVISMLRSESLDVDGTREGVRKEEGEGVALERILARCAVLEAEREADTVEQTMMRERRARLEKEVELKDQEISRCVCQCVCLLSAEGERKGPGLGLIVFISRS